MAITLIQIFSMAFRTLKGSSGHVWPRAGSFCTEHPEEWTPLLGLWLMSAALYKAKGRHVSRM